LGPEAVEEGSELPTDGGDQGESLETAEIQIPK
jgi:hypothetical protein